MKLPDFLKPKRKQSDRMSLLFVNKKVERLKKIKDDNKLAKIAKTDPDSDVRAAAVKLLNESKWQEVLEGILKKDDSKWVRLEAVNKIKDKDILKEVLLNDESSDVKAVILDRLGDDFETVNKIQDAKTLREIIEKTKNQAFLKHVYETNDTRYLQQEAVKKITDQEYLKNILKNESIAAIRAYATVNLGDLDLLNEIINNDKDKLVREEAVISLKKFRIERLKNNQDPDELFRIANNEDEDEEIRTEAVIKLGKDKKLLTDLLENCQKEKVIDTILLYQEEDEKLIFERYMLTTNIVFQKRGLNYIKNKAYLEEIAQYHDSPVVRELALNRITGSVNIIKHIAKNDKDEMVRSEAERLLSMIENITGRKF